MFRNEARLMMILLLTPVVMGPVVAFFGPHLIRCHNIKPAIPTSTTLP